MTFRRFMIAGCVVVWCASGNAEVRDPGGYDRLLAPLITNLDLPGAFGSLWRTDLLIRNDGDVPVQVFQSICDFFCECSIITECPGKATAPHSVAPRIVFVGDLIRNDGALFYVQRRYSDVISFNLRVRDISRNAQSAGTEVPIVREDRFLTTTAHLLNVPLDSGRTHLRIYGISSPSGEGDVLVRVFPLDGDIPVAERALAILPFRFSGGRLPPFSQEDPQPGFAEVPSIQDLVGPAEMPARVRIDVQPVTPGLVFWALVTVTNNETQQVTIVSPQ